MAQDRFMGRLRQLVPPGLIRHLPEARRRKFFRANLDGRRFQRLPSIVGRSDPFPAGALFCGIDRLLTDGDDALVPELSILDRDQNAFEHAVFTALCRHAEGDTEGAIALLRRHGDDDRFDPFRRMCARAWALFLSLPRLCRSEASTGQGPAIVQYWDQAEPPSDVAKAIRDWRDLSPARHRLLDAASARAFLVETYGSEAARIFDLCEHPAIQSDFVRLGWLARHGGLYMDADACMARDFPTHWPHFGGKTVLWFYSHAAKGHFTNGIISAPAGSPLMLASFKEAGRRISEDPQGLVYRLGGPGMLTDMALASAERGELSDTVVMTTDHVRRHVMTQIDAAYKADDRSWHNWQRGWRKEGDA